MDFIGPIDEMTLKYRYIFLKLSDNDKEERQ